MPRYVYVIIAAFLCGYLLGKYADRPGSPLDPQPPERSSVDASKDGSRGLRAQPSVALESGGGAETSGADSAPLPQAGSIVPRRCKVVGIVLSRQDGDLVYCGGSDVQHGSLVAELTVEASRHMAHLEPGVVVDLVGRVAVATRRTLVLEDSRIESSREDQR